MSLFADAKILLSLVRPPRGDTPAQRMESFYARQAGGYDAFRERLLPFRRDLYCDVMQQYLADEPAGRGTWLDLGGGTGGNIEYIADELHHLDSVSIVDLSPSLLGVAKARIQRNGWKNVRAIEADVTRFDPRQKTADVITFSYSLTMISEWERMIDRAEQLLKPGGLIGVVDFYTSPSVAASGMVQHNWWTRLFWQRWFGFDHVHLGPARLARLQQTFETLELRELRARVPYVPLGRVPHFTYIGRRKKVQSCATAFDSAEACCLSAHAYTPMTACTHPGNQRHSVRGTFTAAAIGRPAITSPSGGRRKQKSKAKRTLNSLPY